MARPDRDPRPPLPAAFDTARDQMAVLDGQGRFRWVNLAMAAFVGLPPPDLRGRDFTSFVAPSNPAAPIAPILRAVATTGQSAMFEGIARGAAGPRQNAYSVSLAGREPAIALLVVGYDVTASRQQVAALRESEQFLRLVFEHGPVGIMIASADRRILRANARFIEILGCGEAELSARRIDDLARPEDFGQERPLLERLQKGEVEAYQTETMLRRADGRSVWVCTRTAVMDPEGQVLYLLSFTEDIDARKRAEPERRAMEERLRERQKLEVLGVLAGGIAHDLNNLLVPILGNAELTLNALPASSPHRAALQEILLASQRAALLAQQMQAYSGRGHATLSAVDLSVLVREMAPVLQASLAGNVTITFETTPRLAQVRADAGQMRQALFNLVQNAGEAIGDRDGAVVVSTGVRALTHQVLESFYLPTDLPEGEYVFVRVADTGPGVDPDARARLFDPFFSTKGPGRGLGLPAVLGVVRGHGGALHVETATGTGTAVTVYFPPSAAQPAGDAQETGADRATARSADRGVVLVVEDDEAVRALAARTLERAGYTTHTADDGVKALEFLRAHAFRVNCVVLDLVMPHVQGPAVSRELKAHAPQVPIVIMSGYLHQLTDDVAAMAASVLQKPFTPRTLRDAVGAAVAGRS